jgi:hypothetical protein
MRGRGYVHGKRGIELSDPGIIVCPPLVVSFYDTQLPARLKYPSVELPPVAMAQVEINIPEHLEMQIAQLVEQGEFLNREEAVEDLLSTGLKAYKTSGPQSEEEDTGFEDDGF